MTILYTLTRAQGANRALVDGEVGVPGYQLRIADEPVLVRGFRKMVREMEYDVAELALTTYLSAREHGAPLVALPIFLVRGLHHGAIQIRRDGPVASAKDLVGTRVGVYRGYTVTTGVWARGLLADEQGLDLDSVTWVRSGDEHVESYEPPANVETAPDGIGLTDLLLADELTAVINADIDHPDVMTLYPEPEEAGIAALHRRGLYPINHLVAVKAALLDEHPDAGRALFGGFAAAKQRYMGWLLGHDPVDAQARMLTRVLRETGADPLPYGLDANRAMLEELIRHARAQRILRRPAALEEYFDPRTLDLAG